MRAFILCVVFCAAILQNFFSQESVFSDSSFSSNKLQSFTNARLLEKGKWSYITNNYLYTQTEYHYLYSVQGLLDNRGNYFASLNSWSYGIGERFNLGVEVEVKGVRINDLGDSPFEVFSSKCTDSCRWAVSSLGPTLKWKPFSNLDRFAIQTSFFIPVVPNLEGTKDRIYVSSDSYISITHFMYDFMPANHTQFFIQLSPWIYFNRYAHQNGWGRVSLPVNFFMYQFLNERLSSMLELEFWPNLGKPLIQTHFTELGIGFRYQLIKNKLELNASYTKFILGKNAGAGTTYNLILRVVNF